MSKAVFKMRLLPACCLASVLFHILSVYAAGLFGRYDFNSAVQEPPSVAVDLAALPGAAATRPAMPQADNEEVPADEDRDRPVQPIAAEPAKSADKVAAAEAADSAEQMQEPVEQVAPPAQKAPAEPAKLVMKEEAKEEARGAEAKAAEVKVAEAKAAEAKGVKAEAVKAEAVKEAAKAEAVKAEAVAAKSAAAKQDAAAPATALAGVGAYLSAKYEKLSYRISLHGIPVATAELEAKNDQGVTTITMKVKSNSAISSVFPVDDVVESQQMGGLYLMTKIRQHEGDFRSDETFTINLRKKTVTWFDLVRPRIMKMTVPTDDVLDSLSGIYYLRNRDLQVGKTETLHIFDSESYADVPVEVLRREELRLPNLSKVATLVVRPLQKTAGIFRRTGEVQIWMTDDRSRVPVRIETAIALGKVTAELVSAESKAHGEERREAFR